jgi:hypothetical protein
MDFMSLVCQQEAEQNAQEEGEEDFDEFNPYLFIKQLPPYNEVVSVVCFIFYFMPISDLCCVCVCVRHIQHFRCGRAQTWFLDFQLEEILARISLHAR